MRSPALRPMCRRARGPTVEGMNTTRTSPYVVETEGLSKRFGDRVAVDHVGLPIPAGSAFGYLGPNGAGKTTLIRMLLGLTRATSGSMRLLGHPMPAERAAALARVGAIVEEPRSHPFLTGRENLEIAAAARALAAEGRTVVLSSHLLDEVEKTCDAIAIVDRGRVVVQGSIDELTDGAKTVLVATSDDLRARALLDGTAEPVDGGLRVRASDAAAINRRLVEAGIDVHRLELERVSLERRFLEITSRLEVAA